MNYSELLFAVSSLVATLFLGAITYVELEMGSGPEQERHPGRNRRFVFSLAGLALVAGVLMYSVL